MSIAVHVHRDIRVDHADPRHVIEVQVRDDDAGGQVRLFVGLDRAVWSQVAGAEHAVHRRNLPQADGITHPGFIPAFDLTVVRLGHRVERRTKIENNPRLTVGDRGDNPAVADTFIETKLTVHTHSPELTVRWTGCRFYPDQEGAERRSSAAGVLG